MAAVDLDHLTVRSGGATRLRDVTMSIPNGAFVGVVGASGSGRTTLLRAIGGLEPVASGALRLDGRDLTAAPPGGRDIAMVFQESTLFGHLPVRRNLSFALDVRRHDADEIRRRVDAEARAMWIERLLDLDPATLSTGEQQMVQIARALVRVPKVLLLDEPFVALDDALRPRMRREIAMLQAGYGVTTVMAANDSTDVALTSLVAVIDHGQLVQWDATSAVRRMPATLLAAAATGPLALVEMTVISESRGFWLVRDDPAGGELVRVRAWAPALAAHVGRRVTLGVRPEDVVVAATGAVPARVERAVLLEGGGIQCSVAGARVTAKVPPGPRPAPGDETRLRIDHYVLFDRVTDALIT